MKIARIVVCFPGPRYSVFDTANYYYQAFKDIGCQVEPFNYHNNLVYHEMALYHFYEGIVKGKFTKGDLLTRAASDLLSTVTRVLPDVVFVVSGMAMPFEAWDWLNELRNSLKKPFQIVTLLTESPYIDEEQEMWAKESQVILTTEQKSVERFAKITETYYISHAYLPRIHRLYTDTDYASDVYMVGSGFPERQRLLEGVDWTDIDFKLRGGWDLEAQSSLNQYYEEGGVPNEEAAKWYANARINLNIFRRSRGYTEDSEIEINEAESLGPRVYEVLACGGFLLTDYRPELERFDGGCGVFDDDLDEQVRRWLHNEKERREVAERGYWAVRPYTYQANAIRILEKLGLD